MALNKKIILENGIELNYHRIVSVNEIINDTTIVEVASYINEEKRNEEKQALENSKKSGEAIPMNVFIDTRYVIKNYDEKDNITSCYSYIKTLDDFKDAKDV